VEVWGTKQYTTQWHEPRKIELEVDTEDIFTSYSRTREKWAGRREKHFSELLLQKEKKGKKVRKGETRKKGKKKKLI